MRLSVKRGRCTIDEGQKVMEVEKGESCKEEEEHAQGVLLFAMPLVGKREKEKEAKCCELR